MIYFVYLGSVILIIHVENVDIPLHFDRLLFKYSWLRFYFTKMMNSDIIFVTIILYFMVLLVLNSAVFAIFI